MLSFSHYCLAVQAPYGTRHTSFYQQQAYATSRAPSRCTQRLIPTTLHLSQPSPKMLNIVLSTDYNIQHDRDIYISEDLRNDFKASSILSERVKYIPAACNVRSATTRVTLSRFENRCGACQEIMAEGQQILGHHYQSNELTPSM